MALRSTEATFFPFLTIEYTSETPPSALILAAGPGKRFWPYSVVRNKSRIPPLPTFLLIRRLVDEGYGQSEGRIEKDSLPSDKLEDTLYESSE
jgi:hypothetical protein